MSTSLDRKIEAARLRAEAERKQAGRPATPDEVVAFESGRAVTADQTNMRMRSLLDKMPVAKPYASHVVGEHRTIDAMIGTEFAGAPRMGADKDRKMAAGHAQRVEAMFFNAVNPPVIVDPEPLTADDLRTDADLPPGWFRYRDLLKRPILSWPTGNEAEMKRREETLREMPPTPHGDPLFQRRAAPPDADALRESARKAANEAGGSGISIKESTPKAVEQLILEIAMLRAEVGRLQQECHALRFGQNVQLRGGE